MNLNDDVKDQEEILTDEEKKHSVPADVEMVGDVDVSGSMADPESDDDVLDNAHEMGLYQKSDEEHPAELNVAEQVDIAEKDHQENN